MRDILEKQLLNCKTLYEFTNMYLGLSYQDKLSIFSEEINIPEGAEFYRVRKRAGFNNSNINDPTEWAPVPSEIASQGRFNKKHESVIYLASSPNILERELNIQENEDYLLAKYKCKKSFTVGSTLGRNSLVNAIIHKIVMSVHDPDDFYESENKLIDAHYNSYGKIMPNTIWKDVLSPFYIHRLLPNLYDITNKIGKLIMSKYEDGFRYSSVYNAPIEFSGGPLIITFDGKEYGNYVFTHKGFSNLELITPIEEKTCREPLKLDVMIQTISEEMNKTPNDYPD